MRETLIDRSSLSPTETRALLVRHLVYSCLVIACVTMGAGAVSRWYQPGRPGSAAHVPGMAKTLADCRSELEWFERLREWFAHAEESRHRPLLMFRSLGSALPGDMWITLVTVNGSEVIVEGASPTERTLATFLEGLVSQGVIERVRLDASREIVGSKQGAREFSISGRIAVPQRVDEVSGEYR